MADITALDGILRRRDSDNTLNLIHIHSQVPFEAQMNAFEPSKKGEYKVILATNAAESSLTLPDVDNVICLGTHKQTQRCRDSSDQSQLVNTWIPQSSSLQRAGRTARTRPGTSFRLYSKDLYERLDAHEVPEILRAPLDELILRLKTMKSDEYPAVVPILKSLIESPSDEAIKAAFASLYRQGMITSNGDEAELTQAGKAVSSLGTDVRIFIRNT